jgi:hypothetical protein
MSRLRPYSEVVTELRSMMGPERGEPLDMDIIAAQKARTRGWYPYQYESVTGGLLVTGAVFEPVTRGKRKGLPNFRREVSGTRQRVVVAASEMREWRRSR